jgi:ABC-type dipeptide/oligopeptide/nickel transport system permease subunit
VASARAARPAHPVRDLIGRRAAVGVFTLCVVSVLVFLATQVLPGNAAVAVLGRTAAGNPAAVRRLEAELHLNRGLLDQYWIWFSGLFRGQLGHSLANGQPVWGYVAPRLVNSAVLMLVAGVIGALLGVALGILAALRRDGWFDHITAVGALAVTSLPEFAIGLIILFSTVLLHLLPAVSVLPPGSYAWTAPRLLVLPAATLVIVIVPYIQRMTRAAMIEALESDYVEMAQLKGVPRWRVVLLHALPNATAPIIQVIGLNFLYLAGGVVIVEYVFAFPGIGQGLVYAVEGPGYPGHPVHRRGAGRVLRVHEHRDRRDRPAGHAPAPDSQVRAEAGRPMTAADPPRLRRHPWLAILGQAVRTPRGAAGLGLAGFVALVAIAGPAVAPHPATALLTFPFAKPSGAYPFGADFLGRDVLSRVLDGGWVLLLMAVSATALGIAAGATAGISAAYLRGHTDGLIMRTVDVILAFPQLVFALLLLSILGPQPWLIVLAVGLTHAPAVARVIRAATLDIAERDYVKAAELQGMRPAAVMAKEILPSLSTPLMVEAGLRLTYSIIIMSGLAFLGFGQQPPAANWGMMINENRTGLPLNPWAVIVPAAMIALLTIGTNLLTDAVGQAAIGVDRRPAEAALLDDLSLASDRVQS